MPEHEMESRRRRRPRVRGMLGPDGRDEFGRFGDFEPSLLRSDIEEFSVRDAVVVLDGDGTFEAALRRFNGDTARARSDAGHGYHRFGTGIKKSEFAAGFTDLNLVDLVDAIIDIPGWAEDDPLCPGMFLYGSHQGQTATLVVRNYGRWMIAAVIPADLRYAGRHG